MNILPIMTELYTQDPEVFWAILLTASGIGISLCIVALAFIGKKAKKLARVREDVRRNLQRNPDEVLYGNVYESGAGLQCCCPVCKYGEGDQDTFIDGFSETAEHTCSTCGTKYLTLRIANLPKSIRRGW